MVNEYQVVPVIMPLISLSTGKYFFGSQAKKATMKQPRSPIVSEKPLDRITTKYNRGGCFY